MIDDLLTGWKEITAAEARYDEAEDQYCGKAAEVFANYQVEQAIGSTGEAYKMPLISKAVKVYASRCKLRRVSIPGDKPTTDWIERVWKANTLKVYNRELILNTLKLGDYYAMVWDLWSEGETPEAPTTISEDELEEIGIEFTIHDPRRVRVFYDPENERRKAYALKRWPVPDPSDPVGERKLWRADLYFPDHIEHWLSRQGQPPEKKEGWQPFAEDDPNPHGVIPFIHYRTELLYGRSVMEPGYGAQNAFTKMTITHLATADSQAFRQRFALTDPDAILDSNLDAPDYQQDDEDLATSVDGPLRGAGGQGSALRSGPGTINIFDGLKEVGEFDPADPDVFMEPAEDYLDNLAMLTETPIHNYKPRVQPESGEAKRVAEGQLVFNANDLHDILGDSVEQTWRLAFKIAGKNPKGDLNISWSPAYVADGADDWTMIETMIRCGVPHDVALIFAGFEREQVEQWLDNKEPQMALGYRIEKALQVMQGFQAGGLGNLWGPLAASAAPGGPVFEELSGFMDQLALTTAASGAING